MGIQRVHASVNTGLGGVELRDLNSENVDAIVRFWYDSGDEFLEFLGIDRALLGTEQHIQQRFLRAIPTGDPEQKNMAFAIFVQGQFAG